MISEHGTKKLSSIGFEILALGDLGDKGDKSEGELGD